MKINYFIIVFLLFTSISRADDLIYSTTYEDEATTLFGFSFYKDTFNYHDSNNIFERTFRESDDANFPGMLQFNFVKLYYNSMMDLGLEVNFAIGYNSSRGIFSDDGSSSETRMIVWFLPLDLGLYTAFDVGYFSVSFSGGGSVVGLIQVRSDYSSDRKEKELRQVGLGYYGQAKVKLNLSRIFKGNAFSLFKSHTVTRLSLDVMARFNSYDNFKEESISIDGSSFGVGFTYEYF